MTNHIELQGIEQEIEDLKGWMARIEGLLDSLTGIGSERYCTNEMIAIEMELDTVIRIMSAAADGLERILEQVDNDRYVEWLFTIPADSPLMEGRRARIHERSLDQL
ncbi:MAG: hypothetical protein FJY85_13110 [Deltaproteobacteria bacterium]|nr:hypothetical protein [Deltaproteobacteria bacterium]